MIKVLIIEDNDDIRDNVKEILFLGGYEVFEANNGKTGAELAMKNMPDIILCDIMMGDLDGYGVLHLLNKHDQTKAIPFIFMTAKSERTDVRKGMELGADDYLTKPFDDTELLNAIETRLKKRQIHAEFYTKSIRNLSELVSQKEGLEELKAALEDRKVRVFKKNQIIYYEGDRANGIWVILDGKIKVTKMAEDGRELMSGIFETDHFLAVNTLFSEGLFIDTATTVEESHLVQLPKEQFEEFINLYPDVAGKFIRILASQIRIQEERLIQLAYQSVRKRIAESLFRLHSQSNKQENVIISRIDLAALSGTAPETVSRTLSDLKDEGIIEKKGSNIIILDLKKLENVKN
ncbi:response regulator [Flavobacterium sp.]|uniref:response regulator n=1 Tax=Flavobacterium sp. TaxID=239 RepID=UPI003D6B248E